MIDKKVLIIRTIGNFIVLSSLSGILFTFYPIISAYTKHTVENLRGQKFTAAQTVIIPTQTFGSILGNQDENLKVLVPKDPNFSIIVEKIWQHEKALKNNCS